MPLFYSEDAPIKLNKVSAYSNSVHPKYLTWAKCKENCNYAGMWMKLNVKNYLNFLRFQIFKSITNIVR